MSQSSRINNGRSVPLYKKVILDLRKQIDSGVYQKDGLLPSENELCEVYNTTRPTIRQALSELSNMGYIMRYKGKGSVVAEPKKALGILSVSGVTAGVGSRKLKTVILTKPKQHEWPEEMYDDLSEKELQSNCIYFTRLRNIYNTPVLFEETFISNLGLSQFTKRNLENRSLFQVLSEQYDIEVKGGTQKFWAKKADASISKLLQIKRNSPVVYVRRKLRTNVKDLNIYSWIYCNTEEYYLEDYF